MESLFPLLATDWILVGSSSKSFITTVPRPSSPVEYHEFLHYSGYVTPTWKRHHFMSTWIALVTIESFNPEDVEAWS